MQSFNIDAIVHLLKYLQHIAHNSTNMKFDAVLEFLITFIFHLIFSQDLGCIPMHQPWLPEVSFFFYTNYLQRAKESNNDRKLFIVVLFIALKQLKCKAFTILAKPAPQKYLKCLVQ